MSLQVTLSAPTMIRPDNGAVYCLGASHYRLMNGTTDTVVHLVNSGASEASITGCIGAPSRIITIKPRGAFMLGWVLAATTWRAVRMVETRIAGPEGVPPDAQLSLLTPETPFLVEPLDGPALRVPLSAIAQYLVGKLPTLAGSHSSITTWGHA